MTAFAISSTRVKREGDSPTGYATPPATVQRGPWWDAVRAPDTRSGSSALVLTLRPEFLGDLRVVGRFVTASRRAMRLSHPSIARVEAVRAERHDVAVVIECVEGPTLRSVVEQVRRLRNTIPVWFGLEVTRRVCEALAHAHALRDETGAPSPVCHGTLSAEHVVLTASGAIRITGFGLPGATSPHSREEASSSHDERELSQRGYTAAEAVCDDTRRAAWMLLELLTLVPCEEMPGHGGDELARQCFRPIQDAPWIPRALDEILSRALGPHQRDAITQAGELGAQLSRAISDGGWGVQDEHLAAFVALVAHAERQLALFSAESPPMTATGPSRVLFDDALEEELDWDSSVRPPASGDRVADGARRWEDVTSPGRCPAAPAPGAAGTWEAAVASRQRGQPEGAAAPEVVARPPTIPAPPSARAISEFERGLEQLRQGDLVGAEAAWCRSLELDPGLRAAEANLKLLKKRRASPDGRGGVPG